MVTGLVLGTHFPLVGKQKKQTSKVTETKMFFRAQHCAWELPWRRGVFTDLNYMSISMWKDKFDEEKSQLDNTRFSSVMAGLAGKILGRHKKLLK